jgi:hypothetical protein
MRGTEGMRTKEERGFGEEGWGVKGPADRWAPCVMRRIKKKLVISKGVYESWVGVGRKIGTSNLDERTRMGE